MKPQWPLMLGSECLQRMTAEESRHLYITSMTLIEAMRRAPVIYSTRRAKPLGDPRFKLPPAIVPDKV